MADELTDNEKLEKRLIAILENEVTIDEQVITDRVDEWTCHTGQMHPEDITVLKFLILTLFNSFHEVQLAKCKGSPDRSEMTGALEYIEALFPELDASYWQSNRWKEFKTEQTQ